MKERVESTPADVLAVLAALANRGLRAGDPTPTVAEVAAEIGSTRARARRILLPLCGVGSASPSWERGILVADPTGEDARSIAERRPRVSPIEDELAAAAEQRAARRAAAAEERAARRAAKHASKRAKLIAAGYGARTDAAIAAEAGVSQQCVQGKRARYGIPAANPGTGTPIPEETLAVVAGKMTDGDAALVIGCSVSTVYHYRKKNGIPPSKNRVAGRRRSEAARAARARTMKETDAKYDAAGIGRRPDAAVAADLGVSFVSVLRNRKRRMIPSHAATTGYLYKKTLGTAKRLETDARYLQAGVGKQTDAKVAAALGVSESTVAGYRASRGIPSFKKTQAAEKTQQPTPNGTQAGNNADANARQVVAEGPLVRG